MPERIFAPVGCRQCDGSGYAGRIGIFEMIEIGETLRRAIDEGASESALKDIALNQAETLAGQGLREVAAGRSSLAETLRVVGDVA